MNLLMNGIQATSAVTGRRHELRIRSQEHGPDRILVAVEHFRHRNRAAKYGPAVQRLLHDKAERHGHRPFDLPVDCRAARRRHMGDLEFRGGQHVSVYVAHAWGDAIVATLGQTQSRGGRAIWGLVEVQALATAQIAGCPLWVKSGHVQCTGRCPLCAVVSTGRRHEHSISFYLLGFEPQGLARTASDANSPVSLSQ